MKIPISAQRIRQILLLAGLIGTLVVIVGALNAITVTNRYNELAAIPPPSQEELQNLQQGDPSVMALAVLERDKRDLIQARGRATVTIGLGAAILGVVTFIYLRLPEQSATHA